MLGWDKVQCTIVVLLSLAGTTAGGARVFEVRLGEGRMEHSFKHLHTTQCEYIIDLSLGNNLTIFT